MSEELLAATPAASVSDPIACYEDKLNGRLPVTFVCEPVLTGGETAQIEISTDGGTTFIPAIDPQNDGKLSANRTLSAAYATGIYRVSKGETASPTAVKAIHKNNL